LFQTEINLALQSAGSPALTWLMTGVTYLGYTPVYVALVMALAFAVRLRPTLAVIGGLLLTGLLTEAAKDAVAFPRPDEVDSRVALSAEARPLPLAAPGGATSFWGRPDPTAVAAVRRRSAGNYGFPSGHVSAATAFLACAAWFFHSPRVLVFGAFWVPLMAFSRLYLGRHFLADVLGGFAIGLVASAAAFVLFRNLDADGRRGLRRLWLVCLLVAAAVPVVPLLDARYAGGLVGLVLSCSVLLGAGAPADGGSHREKALRVVVGLVLFTLTLLAGEGLVRLAGGSRVLTLLVTTGAAAAGLVGTVRACRHLRLYRTTE
jgi:membrane-associated phospholipid phosphatase